MSFFLGLLLIAAELFLILIILVQRGKGGGLAGALGGMGGQSAFGAKAGDLFTKITLWTALVWILLCVASVKILSMREDKFKGSPSGSSTPASTDKSGSAPSASGDKAGTASPTGTSGAAAKTGGAAPASDKSPSGSTSGAAISPAKPAETPASSSTK
ncbi:MAG TPA: preprotein translocase subunit SecG [Pirellulales bacterium]|nr:preprotein translocase subunit SecG [Pirellulales bacterium]